MNNEVQHDTSAHRFELNVEGARAFITYEERTGGKLELKHTEVPEELRGQGVGSRLVRGTLDIAKKEGYKIIPSCPYVGAWIERHGEYKSLIAS